MHVSCMYACVTQAFIVFIAVHPRLLSQLLSHAIKSAHTTTLGPTSSCSLSLPMCFFPRPPDLTERVTTPAVPALTPCSKALTNSEYSASYLKTQQPHTPSSKVKERSLRYTTTNNPIQVSSPYMKITWIKSTLAQIGCKSFSSAISS